MLSPTQPQILFIGLCCIDDIYEVNQYPIEDMDIRCLSKFRERGGNASNNCTAMGILGIKAAYLGVIANTFEREFIETDFLKYGIDSSQALIVDDCECPVSCAIISQATGSRTVIHFNKNLPELPFQEFQKVTLSKYSWIHFEGRNVAEVKKMMELIHEYNASSDKKIRISIEMEKTKKDLISLMHLADVIFVSKEFAIMEGCDDITMTLNQLSMLTSKNATLICPWGDLGAGAITNGEIFLSPSYPPDKVVNTLGAGDTFVASTIHAMVCGESVEQSIQFGCKVAGAKVGLNSWEDLKNSINNLDFVQRLKLKC